MDGWMDEERRGAGKKIVKDWISVSLKCFRTTVFSCVKLYSSQLNKLSLSTSTTRRGRGREKEMHTL